MMTLRQFSAEPSTIPTIASWYIADLSKAQGKQELFTHQSSQKLKILREHALIESAVSSNRIEGVNIDQSRIRTVVFGKTLLKDRISRMSGPRSWGSLAKKRVIPFKRGKKKGDKRRLAKTTDEKNHVEIRFVGR